MKGWIPSILYRGLWREALKILIVFGIIIPLFSCMNGSDKKKPSNQGISVNEGDGEKGEPWIDDIDEGEPIEPDDQVTEPVDNGDTTTNGSSNHTPVEPLLPLSVNLTPVAHYGGSSSVVRLMEDYLLFNAGSLLRVVDISNPLAPVDIGSIELDFLTDMVISSSTVYALDCSGFIRIIDMGTPALPRQVSIYRSEVPLSDIVYYDKNTILGIEQGNGLAIIDVSDPLQPILESTVNIPSVINACINGKFLMLAMGEEGVGRLDLNNLAGELETHRLNHEVRNITCRGNYLYLVGDDFYIIVMDANSLDTVSKFTIATDPDGSEKMVINVNSPDGITDLTFPSRINYIRPLPDGLAVTGGMGGVDIMDLTDPESPVIINSVNIEGIVMDAFPYEDYLYLAGSMDQTIRILDISVPALPRLKGGYGGMGVVSNIDVEEDNAVVSGRMGKGVKILDVSDLARIREVFTFELDTRVFGVELAGNLLFLAEGVDGWSLWDLNLPYPPTLVGRFMEEGYVSSMRYRDNEVWVAAGSRGVRVYDLTEKSSPRLIDYYKRFLNSVSITFHEEVAFSIDASGDLFLLVLDESGNLQRLGFYNSPGFIHDISFKEDIAYLADKKKGLIILDVSNRKNPEELVVYNEEMDIPGSGNRHIGGKCHCEVEAVLTSVAYDKGALYLGKAEKGIVVMDARDTSSLKVIGRYPQVGDFNKILIKGDYIYLSAGMNGLIIYQINM